jgi:hypothetical protein
MTRGSSTPNLVRIIRDPKLYDEAMAKVEARLEFTGYGKASATSPRNTGNGKHSLTSAHGR